MKFQISNIHKCMFDSKLKTSLCAKEEKVYGNTIDKFNTLGSLTNPKVCFSLFPDQWLEFSRT